MFSPGSTLTAGEFAGASPSTAGAQPLHRRRRAKLSPHRRNDRSAPTPTIPDHLAPGGKGLAPLGVEMTRAYKGWLIPSRPPSRSTAKVCRTCRESLSACRR